MYVCAPIVSCMHDRRMNPAICYFYVQPFLFYNLLYKKKYLLPCFGISYISTAVKKLHKLSSSSRLESTRMEEWELDALRRENQLLGEELAALKAQLKQVRTTHDTRHAYSTYCRSLQAYEFNIFTKNREQIK